MDGLTLHAIAGDGDGDNACGMGRSGGSTRHGGLVWLAVWCSSAQQV